MKTKKMDSQSGKSLIEVLIVVVISSVLVTFAVAQLGQSRSNLQRQNIARELKVSLERARFDSVKRRASVATNMARVRIDSATSFSVITDINQNGTIDTTDVRQVNFSSSNTRIVGIAAFPVTISFDQRGQISVTGGTSTFIICETCTAETATAQNSNVISVSPTGTVSMMSGGESQPTFQNPVVSDVETGWDIKSSVSLSSSTNVSPYPTPTATPTATPTPSPTATPTPNGSPTPTPTPVPTPTPTPTPRTCSRNQRPLQDNCVCVAPMFVRGNGKCQ